MDEPEFGGSATAVITGKIMAMALIVLLLVVLFVLFLHLYVKRFWWGREEPTPHTSSRSGRRFVFAARQDTGHPHRGATKGLDSTILASLPVLIFTRNEFKEGLECAVCLCELVEGEKARLLPKCSHGFHVECIDMWFQSHSTCPLCRNPIVGVEIDSPKHSVSDNAVNVQVQIQSPNDGYSSDLPSFPTNVLFWGIQVEEGTSASIGSSAMATASSSGRQEDMLVIDVPMNGNENFSEEESKNPLPTRLRSLKRLLSREKRVAPSSSESSSDSVSADA